MMTQAEYSRYKKVSKAYVSRLIKVGKIPPSAWKWEGKKRMIDSDLADQALIENLDPAFTRKIKPKSAPDLELEKMELNDIVEGLNNGEIKIDARRAILELQQFLDSSDDMPEEDRLELEETLDCFKFAVKADPDFIKKTTPWVIV